MWTRRRGPVGLAGCKDGSTPASNTLEGGAAYSSLNTQGQARGTTARLGHARWRLRNFAVEVPDRRHSHVPDTVRPAEHLLNRRVRFTFRLPPACGFAQDAAPDHPAARPDEAPVAGELRPCRGRPRRGRASRSSARHRAAAVARLDVEAPGGVRKPGWRWAAKYVGGTRASPAGLGRTREPLRPEHTHSFFEPVPARFKEVRVVLLSDGRQTVAQNNRHVFDRAPQRPLDTDGQWDLQAREPLAFLGLPKKEQSGVCRR
jgi:hypothetical protein